MKDDKLRSIKNGTVIDHVPFNLWNLVVKILKLNESESFILGHGFKSSKFGKKDMVKIENRFLSQEEANVLSLIAPEATISIIKDSKVFKKMKVQIPDEIESVIECPNESCVTNHESGPTRFKVFKNEKGILLECHFCEKQYPVSETRFKI